MSDGKGIVGLGFSRWRSDMLVLGVAAIVGVLIGVGIVSWLVASGQTDAFGIGFGLIYAGSVGWLLPHCWIFMRSRLLVDAAGVQLDASGRRTYRWAEIEGFDVRKTGQMWGLTSVGADMRVRDGRVIPLVLLDRFASGDASVRAIAEITTRVGMMNRLLAEANDALQTPRL